MALLTVRHVFAKCVLNFCSQIPSLWHLIQLQLINKVINSVAKQARKTSSSN